MTYENLKEELKSRLGNNCCIFKGTITCFAKYERTRDNISAEIPYFEGDLNTFGVKFTDIRTNKWSIKEYNSIDSFINDFKDVINLINEMERVYKNINLRYEL